jgi:hypothetical protein
MIKVVSTCPMLSLTSPPRVALCISTVRAHPQQNGVAEQANRVLAEHITTMLDESGLPKAFWGECLAALVHVWNRCPTDAVDNAMPYELWHGSKPDVSHLRVWGCTAYVHVQKNQVVLHFVVALLSN